MHETSCKRKYFVRSAGQRRTWSRKECNPSSRSPWLQISCPSRPAPQRGESDLITTFWWPTLIRLSSYPNHSEDCALVAKHNAHIQACTFIALASFNIQTLAHALNVLVRVSRLVERHHQVSFLRSGLSLLMCLLSRLSFKIGFCSEKIYVSFRKNNLCDLPY